MRRDPSPSMLACVGSVAAVLVAALSVLGIKYGQGEFEPTYEVSAVFPSSAQGVFTDGATDVKLRGVNVGTVSGVELLPDGRARLTLEIDKGIEVPATTSARLEPLSVFGPKFVSLEPGEGEVGGPFLADGGEIAVAATGTELTDVLDGATELFGSVDPGELVSIFDAVSTGVRGLGDELGSLIDDGTELLGVADANRGRLEEFLPDLRTVTTATASRADTLLRTVDDVRVVSSLLAERDDDLRSLFATSEAVAGRLAGLIDTSAEEIDLSVRAMAAVIRGIYDQRELLPRALDTVGAFFEMLGAGMRLPGPDGKNLTALKGFIVADLCLVYGVCLLPNGSVDLAPILGGDVASAQAEPDTSGVTGFAGALVDPVGSR